jgi:phosphoglycerate dehydrogenase-like enzyme
MKKPSIIFAVPRDVPFFDVIFSDEARNCLDRLGWTIDLPDVPIHDRTVPWRDILKGYDAVITSWSSPRLDKNTLAPDAAIRVVGHAAGSVANLVSPELYERGIRVTCANDVMAQSVAEWCLAMTLFGLRGFLDYASFGGMGKLRWDRRDRPKGIQEARIGIWGCGDIARHFIRLLGSLEPAEIMVCDDYLTEEAAQESGVRNAELEDIFSESDVIVLLQAYRPDTAGRIGAEELARVRDGTVLLNCARAGLIREDALLTELEKGRFTGIFDVYHEEPLPEDSPLHRMPNVILSPHCAGLPGREKYMPLIIEEFERFFAGKPLLHEISRERAATMTSLVPRPRKG